MADRTKDYHGSLMMRARRTYQPPDRSAFTDQEWHIIQAHKTPRAVQNFLRTLPYNFERDGKTCASFRGVVRDNIAHCLEGALAAATILEQHGYPPLLLSLESQDKLDHVILLYRRHGLWGGVARSRDPGLHGRKPVFRTLRHLVYSYVDAYIDITGRITGYGVGDLRNLGSYNWQLSPRNVWKVENYLIEMSHRKLKTSDSRYHKFHRKYRGFKKRFPDARPEYFANRHQWL